MNTVNMPGFTAEDSLYPTSERYRMTCGVALSTNSVQPSAAIYEGGRFICYGEITDTGYINCYPPPHGSPPGELVCGPCRNGRQRCGIPGVGFQTVPCSE